MQNQAPIGVLIQDPMARALFSHLLQAFGQTAVPLQSVEQADPEWRMVTEPLYFGELSDSQKSSCLVVGSEDSVKDLEVETLTQPLTEEKIESALTNFLEVEVTR